MLCARWAAAAAAPAPSSTSTSSAAAWAAQQRQARVTVRDLQKLLWAWAQFNRHPGEELLEGVRQAWVRAAASGGEEGAMAAAAAAPVDALCSAMHSLAILREHRHPLMHLLCLQLSAHLAASAASAPPPPQQQQQELSTAQQLVARHARQLAACMLAAEAERQESPLVACLPANVRIQVRAGAAAAAPTQPSFWSHHEGSVRTTKCCVRAACVACVGEQVVDQWRRHSAKRASGRPTLYQMELRRVAGRIGVSVSRPCRVRLTCEHGRHVHDRSLPSTTCSTSCFNAGVMMVMAFCLVRPPQHRVELTPDGIVCPDVTVGLHDAVPGLRFALELVGPHNTAANSGRLLGSAALKYRLLQARGYLVVPISCKVRLNAPPSAP